MKTRMLSLVAVCLLASQSQSWAENQPAAPAAEAPATVVLTNDVKNTESSSSAAKVQNVRRQTRTQPVAAQPSPVVWAVVSMTKAGVEASVMEAYVQDANVLFLRPDEIVYLHNHGVSPQVVAALLKRSNELRLQQAQALRNAQERLAQQRAAEAATIAAQSSVWAPGARSPIYNYYVNTPPAYNWGYQFYAYPYAVYPNYSYSYTRPSRGSQSPPAQSFTPAPGSAGVQSPNSPSFFISRWQVNGTTGKPMDLR